MTTLNIDILKQQADIGSFSHYLHFLKTQAEDPTAIPNHHTNNRRHTVLTLEQQIRRNYAKSRAVLTRLAFGMYQSVENNAH